MKKFVVLYVGYAEPTAEIRDAVGRWFAAVSSHLVDSGSPLGPGRAVTGTGSRDLTPADGAPITGYTILSAESLEAAEKLLDGFPIIDSIRVYEAMPM